MNDDHLIERTLDSQELLRWNFLHIKRDTVRLPDGSTATREYIVHPGAVVMVPLLDDGRLVMERQYRYPVGQVMIEFPAGKLDHGEDPLGCAKRELLEETGYGEGAWEKLATTVTNPTSSTSRIHVFLARGVRKLAEPQSDPRETVEVREAPPAEFMRMLLDGTIASQTAMTAAFLAAVRLGWLETKV